MTLDQLTPEQETDADAIEYLVMIAENADLHPVDEAQMIEREIDEDLPYPLVFRGEADEFIPYRPASLNVEETLPL